MNGHFTEVYERNKANVLHALAYSESPVPISELVRITDIGQSSVYRMVKRMEPILEISGQINGTGKKERLYSMKPFYKEKIRKDLKLLNIVYSKAEKELGNGGGARQSA